jgi:hypothetical protein
LRALQTRRSGRRSGVAVTVATPPAAGREPGEIGSRRHEWRRASPVSDHDTAGVTWFVDGYRRALARFNATETPEHDAKERFLPLFETLSWAVAIVMPDPRRPRRPQDPIIRGLRFARNRVHHAWADALEARHVQIRSRPLMATGRRPMIHNPLFVVEWVWKPLERVGVPTHEKHRHGIDDYRDHLADKSVRLALSHLDGLLDELLRESGW